MRLLRKTATVGLFIICLAINVAEYNGKSTLDRLAQGAQEVSIKGLPSIAQALSRLVKPPLGQKLAGRLFLLQSAVFFMKGALPEDEFDYDLMTIERLEKTEVSIVKESQVIINDLTYSIESYNFLRRMRQLLEEFQATYRDNINCLLDATCTGILKESLLDDMIIYTSDFRRKLRSFISSYIQPATTVLNLDSQHLYFDFLLMEHHMKQVSGDDCYSESLSVRIYKSYMYIMEVLSKGYSMVTAAHAIRYKQYSTEGKTSDADTMKKKNTKIAAEFLSDLNILMSKTKWALKISSKIIRNCATSTLERGITFQRLDFITKRIRLLVGYDKDACREITHNFFFDNSLHLSNCKKLDSGDHKFYGNASDLSRPLYYMTNYRGEVFGRQRESPNQLQSSLSKHCSSEQCDGYIPGVSRISTEFVRAQSGYVVTGIRWKVVRNLIQIQIQEGKFIDATQVDSKTVHWVETRVEEHEQTALTHEVTSIFLDDFILPLNFYVTGIRIFLNGNGIGFRVAGLEAKDQTGLTTNETILSSDDVARADMRRKSELKIVGDDPEMAPNDSKSIIAKNNGNTFLKLQASDWKKDLGRTTIPYFDIRDVVTKPSAPISGIGIYHEAVPGYGGFVRLRMYSPKFHDMINEKDFDEYTSSLGIERKK